MPKIDYLAKFIPEVYYHVYNRTNNREEMFRDDSDRRYFLQQYKRFVSDYVETLAFCLMPNHFHFAVQVKPIRILLSMIEAIPVDFRTIPQKKLLAEIDKSPYFHSLIANQFTRMFTAYADYFNKKYKRSGNFFYRPFKRVAVDQDIYRCWLIYYIHHNPKKHKVFEEFLKYPWSSYSSLLSEEYTYLNRAAVWDIFAGKEYFVSFHEGTEAGRPEYLSVELEG